ncbi:MAG: hypothetical protein RLZZ546_2724, partial [Bacteroidota bacterium]
MNNIKIKRQRKMNTINKKMKNIEKEK